MKLLIVGDGPVARSFAAALAEHAPARWWRKLGGQPAPCEVALLAVSDRAIGEVAERVLATSEEPVLIHAAGGLAPEEPFSQLSRRPRGVALCHPLRSLSQALPDLRGTIFAIGGDPQGLAVARELVRAAGGEPLPITPEEQARYHAAAALASNHVVGLVDAARELLAGVGLSSEHAHRALAGLLRSVADNLEREGLPRALTGPIARGDLVTIERHLRALGAHPEIDALYRASASRVLEVARKKGQASADALDRIASLLYPDRPIK